MKCTSIDEELSRPLRRTMKRQQSEKWHSVYLQHIGLLTDLTFVQLVDEATNASMREASEGGLLAKLTA